MTMKPRGGNPKFAKPKKLEVQSRHEVQSQVPEIRKMGKRKKNEKKKRSWGNC